MQSFAKKVASVAGCAALLLSVFASAPRIAAESAVKDGTGAADASKGESTYYDYQKAHASVPYADDTIDLKLSAATVKTATISTWLNTKAVVIDKGGYAEWTVDIPKTAKYQLELTYSAVDDAQRDLEFSLMLDEAYPFSSAKLLTLKRLWKDATAIKQDQQGNDLIPAQEQLYAWNTVKITDYDSYVSDGLAFVLKEGTHTLRIACEDNAMAISNLKLTYPVSLPSYAQRLAEYEQMGAGIVGDTQLYYQAENTQAKSDRTIYPTYDRNSAATQPNHPSLIKRNTIGTENWSSAGMFITYTITDVPQDGLYALSFKFRQNMKLGLSVFRDIYINGEIPYKELRNVRFDFGFRWQTKTLADDEGNPYYVFLKKGKNTVTLSVTLGLWGDILQDVDAVNVQMNELYRRIIMITSTNPDTYRDYFLDREIDGLAERFAALSKQLFKLADNFADINGKTSNQSESLRRVAEQLADFAEDVDVIPKRLVRFRDNIAMLSEWVLTNKEQPLELDYFIVHSADASLPNPNASFWENITFKFKQFIAAFSDDYNSMEDYADTDSALTVWVNDGRDQVQILKDMINDRFTSETGIPVNVNLVQSGFVEATLSGKGPDIAMGVSRGQPVNLASRGALADLSKYSGFEDTLKRFGNMATVPFQYNGGTYALPMTQTYFVMFYRTDIFKELGLTVPQTWTELLDTAAVLQRKNMTVGLPYSSITASGAIDAGVGAKDLFSTLLLQMGGSFYKDDLLTTGLDSANALKAFKLWTSFYTKYGFYLSYDFNTRFRTGEMPLAVASYTMYGVLEAAAPEIRGQWAMTLMPGVKQADGTINRAGGATGSAVVMFRNTKNKENGFRFIEWLTRSDVQSDFGNAVESQMGSAARYATANLEAFNHLGWTKDELQVLNTQRTYIREVEEVPGSYFISRNVDNAFRAVIYDNENPRNALERENESINRELARKHEELAKP